MASMLLLLLLLFLRASANAAALNHHHHHSEVARALLPGHAALPPTHTHRACRATLSTAQCESALSQLSPDASALDAVAAAISAATRGIQTARARAQSIAEASASNLNRSNAARNCLELISYSERRLDATVRSLRSGSLADAHAFTGAAELYQHDCWSALKYVNGTRQVADAMSFLAALTDLTGVAASMLAALRRYGSGTSRWASPQTERDGYCNAPKTDRPKTAHVGDVTKQS